MRLMDANVIVYTFTGKPKKNNVNPQALKNKENAKNIIKRLINGDETVYMTSIQVSEAMNMTEKLIGIENSLRVQDFMLNNPSIKIIEITHQDMLDSHIISEKYKENKIGFNDAIAYIGMMKSGCTEIYTFDKHFNIFNEIKCVN